MQSERNDREILRLLRGDPPRGFELLVSSYGGLVKTICQNILAGFSPADVEEAMADCFLAFWQSAEKIQVSDSLKGYLIGITRNCALNKRENALKAKGDIPIQDAGYCAEDTDIAETVTKNRNAELVREVLDELPEQEKEIFVRRYFLCERIKDIAAHVGCDAKRAENVLYRQKEKLKQKLLERGISI